MATRPLPDPAQGWAAAAPAQPGCSALWRRGRNAAADGAPGLGSVTPWGLSPLKGGPSGVQTPPQHAPADGRCGKGGHAASSSDGFGEYRCQFSISIVTPTALFLLPLLYLVSVWHSACQIPLLSCIIFCYTNAHNSSLFPSFLSPFLSFLLGIAFYVVILFISTLGFSFIY